MVEQDARIKIVIVRSKITYLDFMSVLFHAKVINPFSKKKGLPYMIFRVIYSASRNSSASSYASAFLPMTGSIFATINPETRAITIVRPIPES